MTRDCISVRPVSQDHNAGAGVPAVIRNRPRGWRWKPGSIESCHSCLSLNAGITVVVGMLRAILNGIMLLMLVQLQRHGYTFRITFYWNAVEKLMVLEKRFRAGCEGEGDLLALSENDCRQLEQTINNIDNNMTLQENQGIIYVYGYIKLFCFFVGLVGGIVGVWTGIYHSKLAAKMFLWSWPLNFVLSVVSWIVMWLAMEQLSNNSLRESDLLPSTFTFVISSINLGFLAFFIKVLKARGMDPPPCNDSGVKLYELRGGDDRSDTLV